MGRLRPGPPLSLRRRRAWRQPADPLHHGRDHAAAPPTGDVRPAGRATRVRTGSAREEHDAPDRRSSAHEHPQPQAVLRGQRQGRERVVDVLRRFSGPPRGVRPFSGLPHREPEPPHASSTPEGDVERRVVALVFALFENGRRRGRRVRGPPDTLASAIVRVGKRSSTSTSSPEPPQTSPAPSRSTSSSYRSPSGRNTAPHAPPRPKVGDHNPGPSMLLTCHMNAKPRAHQGVS